MSMTPLGTIKAAIKTIYEIRERLIHIEGKIDQAPSHTPECESGSTTSHPDQWFGSHSYSQHGEDLLILNIFKRLNIEKPSYLDIGAHHPFDISNTCLIYQRGGRGINVEANPNLIQAFHTARPEDINLNIGVTETQGNMKFYMIDERSGRNTFDKAAAESFVENNPGFSITKVLDIPTTSINEIIEKHANQSTPDFLSIDTEGADESIARSLDLETYGRPKVICVETIDVNGNDVESLVGYLKDKRYESLVRMGGNTIFVDSKYIDRLR